MNENKITCELCRDLIPLVKDGVASADSEAAVRIHIAGCSGCALLFDGKSAEDGNPAELPREPRGIKRAKRYLTAVYAVVMLLGLYVGLSLTDSADMFFNTLIMPIAGILGYLAFRIRSLYIVPVLLLIINIIANGLGLFVERLDALSVISWTFIYSLFALAGIVISILLHFAFGGKNNGRSDKYEH
ncbi:MAG: zf-HC2 domain-containing protein [Oscillospiraceae bacterium]|nr:zf-HC2 domain-containing protein [Oscillospiraceae bacterium]